MPVVVPVSPTATGTVNVPTLARRIRQKFLEDEPYEALTTAVVTPSDTTINLSDPTKWGVGNVGEFDDGTGSQFRISEQPTPLTNPITVKYGHHNTPVTAHDDGAVVLKSPRFGYDQLRNVIDEVCTELWPYVWNVGSFTVSPSTTTNLYDVPSDFIDLIGASQQSTGSITDVLWYGPKTRPILPVSDISSSLAASTQSLRFPGGFFNQTKPVTIYYRVLVTEDTIQEGDMARLVEFGVVASLMASKEVPLSSKHRAPGETNLAPGAMQRTASWYESKFISQRAKLNAKLMSSQKTAPARRWVG
jgi:hypothetical protein